MPETVPETELRLGIGQAAERTGLSVHALRFYEREGLLVTPVHRGADGRRVYSESRAEGLADPLLSPEDDSGAH